MKDVQQPTPPKNSMSKGLLSPHNSILDALNDCSEATTRLSRTQAIPLDRNPVAKDKENFNVSSWLDINNNDYFHLYPIKSRPGSSVLSSSPDLDTARNQEPCTKQHHNGNLVFNESPSHGKAHLNHPAEAFIFPDYSVHRERLQEQQLMNPHGRSDYCDSTDDKILILGSKKFQIYDSLSLDLQNNFALQTNLNPSIILVVFDGLNKIGNILNQLKFIVQQQQASMLKSQQDDRDLIIIPFYRNLDSHVILYLLERYKLLCHPIRYNNRRDINFVLSSLLSNNYLENQFRGNQKSQRYINLSDNDDHTIELPMNQDNIIPIKSFTDFTNNNLALQSAERRRVSNKSILIKHQITKSLSTLNLSNFNNTVPPLNGHNPKRRRQTKRNSLWTSVYKFFTSELFSWKYWESKKYLIVPLSIGLGIGIILALSQPYLKFFTSNQPHEEIVIRSTKKMNKELFKKNMMSLNTKCQGLVKYLMRKTNKIVDKWDEHIINSSNGCNATMLWSI